MNNTYIICTPQEQALYYGSWICSSGEWSEVKCPPCRRLAPLFKIEKMPFQLKSRECKVRQASTRWLLNIIINTLKQHSIYTGRVPAPLHIYQGHLKSSTYSYNTESKIWNVDILFKAGFIAGLPDLRQRHRRVEAVEDAQWEGDPLHYHPGQESIEVQLQYNSHFFYIHESNLEIQQMWYKNIELHFYNFKN